jgi:hypothetical protein
MPLNDIIRRAIELNTVLGVTKQPRAVQDAVSLILSDQTVLRDAATVAAAKLIHDSCTKAMRQLPADTRQGSLFLLRDRYALDGDRIFKDTDRLSEIEFLRVLALRKKQIEDDTKHYRQMVIAYAELGPIWREFPEKLLGEIEAIWIRRRSAA